MLGLWIAAFVAVLFLMALLIPAAPRVPSARNWFTTESGTTTADVRRPHGDDPKGTVLLIHGFCENHLYFEMVADALAEAGFTAVAINLYGYAGSQAADGVGHGVDDYARQIAEVAAEIDRDPDFAPLVGIWGHSMGATSLYRAMSRLTTSPTLRLLVFEAPGFPQTVSVFARLLIPASRFADSWLVRRFLQFWTDLIFVPEVRNEPGRRFLRRILVDYAPRRHVALQNVRSILATHFEGIPASWMRAGIRLYFVFASRDRLISHRRVRRQLLSRFPAAADRVVTTTLPETDHFISLQRPDLMAGRVSHLLASGCPEGDQQQPGRWKDSARALG